MVNIDAFCLARNARPSARNSSLIALAYALRDTCALPANVRGPVARFHDFPFGSAVNFSEWPDALLRSYSCA